MRPQFIQIQIPATKEQHCLIEIPPGATEPDILAALARVQVPTDSSVLPELLKQTAAKYHGATAETIRLVMANTLGRAILIVLKPKKGPVSASNPETAIGAVHTDGLWPYVNDLGRIEVQDQIAPRVGQDVDRNARRFVRLLIDLGNGQRDASFSVETGQRFLETVAQATSARITLAVERAKQDPESN
jgi:hypothetical protein